MIGLSAGKEFLKLINAVPYTGEHPIGCFIVAPPGSGKSYLLTSIQSKNFILVSDITAYGMEKLLLDLTRVKTGYVVVPDLLRAMSRKPSFEQLVSLLNILLEEGVRVIKRHNLDLTLAEPLRFGFISALTTDEFRKIIPHFLTTGLLSRILVFSFHYEPSDVSRIKDIIISSSEDNFATRINGITAKEVSIPPKLKNLLLKLSHSPQDKYGFRSLKLLRKLVKARALLHGRSKATKMDVLEVFCFSPFISYATEVELNSGSDLMFSIMRKIIKKAKRLDELTVKGYTDEEIQHAAQELLRKGFLRIDKTGKLTIGGV